MYITQFGDYTFPEQLELNESGGVSRRNSQQALGGAGGAVDLQGTGPDPLEADEITKSVWFDAGGSTALRTSLDSAQGAMMISPNDWRQGTRLLFATMPDGTKRVTWAKCVDVQIRWEYFHINRGWVPLTITWQRAWPVWLTEADLRFFGDHLGDFSDTALFDFDGGGTPVSQSVTVSPTNFTITNSGNARAMWGLIEFDGQITNPRLDNLTNGFWFQYTGAVTSSQRLTMYIEKFYAQHAGAAVWGSITLGSSKGQMVPMALEPGSNSMRVTGTSPNCTLRYYFGDSWY